MVQLLSPAFLTFLLFISTVAAAPAESSPASIAESSPVSVPESTDAEAEIVARACSPSPANKATLKLIEGFEGWSAKACK